jgi:hypothetical protein
LFGACQVSGLERLSDGGEVLGAISSLECLSIPEWAVLTEGYEGVIGLLCSIRVSRLQRLS